MTKIGLKVIKSHVRKSQITFLAFSTEVSNMAELVHKSGLTDFIVTLIYFILHYCHPDFKTLLSQHYITKIHK